MQISVLNEKRIKGAVPDISGLFEGLALPLLLFAALSAALCRMFGLVPEALPLAAGAAVIPVCGLAKGRARIRLALLMLALSAAAFALFPAIRAGFMGLANRLFAISEASNAYAYEYFSAAAAEGTAFTAAKTLLFVFTAAFCAAACEKKGLTVLLICGTALAEAFFGVTPGLLPNILLFLSAVLVLSCGLSGAAGGAALTAAAAVLAAAVFIAFPRPIAAVEDYSEQLRDRFSEAAVSVSGRISQYEEERSSARQESRQHDEQAQSDPEKEDRQREFEKQTEEEQEISLPERPDWLKGLLYLLLTILLLLIPILPLWFLKRAGRIAGGRREAFLSADDAQAIRAMFPHSVDWLREAGLRTDNRPFTCCGDSVEALMSGDYRQRFDEAAAIWQEAEYSGHEMSAEQRALVGSFLDETALSVLEKAGRWDRFRLRYILCYTGAEK